ncbi:class I SAM-dependent methyltransferase [Companilactobacillus sp. DQM5]|uniref:class I SAM-dependent methyltransferase n=1 Tax=Companilactobacillus sp. DQM5 TaxID=3463359 RepID=UPI004059F172
MAEEKIEQLFKQLVATTTILKDSLQVSNHDALSENIHDLLTGEVFVENGAPDKKTVDKLEKLYNDMSLSGFTKENIFNVMQLAILKAEQDDNTEVNKLMTPSSVAMITSIVLHELIVSLNVKSTSLLDPVIGNGNLMLQLINNIESTTDTKLTGIGIDNDDSLLSVADSYSQLIDTNLELYHQDSVSMWPVSDLDFVIADLPVGYYPMEEGLDKFETKSKSGKSYAHHLLIENSMKHLKNGGFGLFIVPSEIFETNQSESLAKWMVSNVYLQGVLSFPTDMFHSKSAQKSLVILQKHGDGANQVQNVLMGEIPSLKDIKLVKRFESEIKKWAETNFK